MDRQDLFDALAIRVSDITSRRHAVVVMAKLLLAILVFGISPWRARAQDLMPESQLVKGCRLPGQKCTGKGDCCAKKCDNDHRCGCINKGKEPLVDTPLGPVPVKALCCTNKLNKRTGECK